MFSRCKIVLMLSCLALRSSRLKMFSGNAVNFRTPFSNNTSAGLLLIFSELLALEVTKSNDVQI